MAQQQIINEGTVSRDAFIATMRQVAASVAVVTTDGPAGRHGATVSTFCSVSADPPTILICLSAERRIAKAVRNNQDFCVNLLSQNHIAIANRFAGMDDNRINDRFFGIDHYGARGVPPALDAATVFSCKTEQLVASGSHLVVIGRVTAVRAGDPAPLTYLDGGYHALVPAHSEHNHLTQTTV